MDHCLEVSIYYIKLGLTFTLWLDELKQNTISLENTFSEIAYLQPGEIENLLTNENICINNPETVDKIVKFTMERKIQP
jgi:hypothetical protein